MKFLILFLFAVTQLLMTNTAIAQNSSPDPESLALLQAVSRNEYQNVITALNKGADVNTLRPYDAHTPLMIAANRNYVSIAKLLIQSKADLNLTTLFNRTALQIAALNNSFEVAKLLSQQKNMDVNNGGRKCALAVAARQGYIKIVILLAKLKNDQAPTDKCYQSAISMAEYNHHQDIVDLLKQ